MHRTKLMLAAGCLAVPFVLFVTLVNSGCDQPTASSPPVAIPSEPKGAAKDPPPAIQVTQPETEPANSTKTESSEPTEPNQTELEKPPVRTAEKPVDPGAKKSNAPKPMLVGWGVPAAALILSGEQHGYLEPCGCSELQSGGVSRRADLFRQLTDKKWPLSAIDLGGVPRRERAQSRIKYEVIRKSLIDMGYALQGLGPEELQLGTDSLVAMMPDSTDPAAQLPFVAANVVFYDDPTFTTPAKKRLLKVGDVKIGVTSILDPALGKTIAPEGSGVNWKITPAEEAVKKALAELEADKPDLLVLLSHAELPVTKKLAEAFPQVDLILSAGGPEDPDDKPVRAEKPMIVNVGKKGKYVGVVGYYPNEKNRLRYELVNLDKLRFQETHAMHVHMRDYQERLKNEEVAKNESPLAHPTGHTFVGAAKCGECHTKAFAKWKTTAHAHAFDSLTTGGDVYKKDGNTEPFVSRIFDAECLACHTVGWNPQEVLRFDSGYLPPEFASSEAEKARMLTLRGNQCENCHGPGSHHVKWAEGGELSKEDAAAAKVSLRVTLAAAKDQVCYKCHDTDNSPHFNSTTFDEYWDKVKHPGKD